MNVVATAGLCGGCRESPESLTTPEPSEQLPTKNRESLDEWLARGNQPQEGVSMNCFRPSYHRLHEITDDAGVEPPRGYLKVCRESNGRRQRTKKSL